MANSNKKPNKRRGKTHSTMQYLSDLKTLVTGQAPDGSSAEEQMQEICAFYQSIIENMPNHVYWLDKNCVLRGGNNKLAQFFGLKSAAELTGLTYEEMSRLANWTEGQGLSFKSAELEIMSTGIPRLNVEEPVVFVNGKPAYFISNKVPLSNNKGEIIGVLGISTDITELKETQAALEKSKAAAEAGEKAKIEFIANVSHDMRTPLSGIIHLTHDLEEEVISTAERKKLCAQLAASGDALLEMFEEILEDVAAEHMTEQDITLETFDINHLVDKLITLERPSLTQKGLKLLTNIDQNIPQYLVSDRRKIHRIALNLIGNAVKFTKKGQIELKIERIDTQNDPAQISLKFHVIDSGIGVSNDAQKHLFERFYKASPSYQTEYKGFGLGLHIAKTYTHLLGGTIGFESQEGVGSDFYAMITLKIANPDEIANYHKKLAEKPPLLKVIANKAPIPVKSTALSSIPEVPHILIVEDNLIVRLSTVRLVKKFHLNTSDVEDGKLALELAKTQHFDLILSDVGLIEMSGIEFAQQLRAFEREKNKPPVPIIGITAHAIDSHSGYLDAGMNAVTTKPLSKDTFREILQKFLPNYRQVDSL